MPFQLIPGLLSMLQQVEHDDAHHKLVINDRVAPLSPTQYALTLALLRQRKVWEASGGQAPLCVSVMQLMQRAELLSREVLLRQLSSAGMRLAPFGLHILNVHSYGYLILFEAEVPELAP